MFENMTVFSVGAIMHLNGLKSCNLYTRNARPVMYRHVFVTAPLSVDMARSRGLGHGMGKKHEQWATVTRQIVLIAYVTRAGAGQNNETYWNNNTIHPSLSTTAYSWRFCDCPPFRPFFLASLFLFIVHNCLQVKKHRRRTSRGSCRSSTIAVFATYIYIYMYISFLFSYLVILTLISFLLRRVSWLRYRASRTFLYTLIKSDVCTWEYLYKNKTFLRLIE